MAQASFGPVQQIEAGLLDVGYVEAGPEHGQPVILLHGWPYDIHSYADAAPALRAAGYRVIVPFLRGYGTTLFLSDETVRNGQQSVLAVDVIALMDELRIESAIVAGSTGVPDRQRRRGTLPERCKAMVSVSGNLIGSREADKAPLPPSRAATGGNTRIGPSRVASGTICHKKPRTPSHHERERGAPNEQDVKEQHDRLQARHDGDARYSRRVAP